VIYKKLFEIQKAVTALSKDKETKDYSYVSSEKVLDTIRPLMNEHGLMLTMQTTGRSVRTDLTKSEVTRYFTEIDITFTWVDVETCETLIHTFTAQGSDLAGEKGIGKALTYGEKYYFLKLFHVSTPKDDPDGDKHNKDGEKGQKGTQAAKETADYQRKSIKQMAEEIGKAASVETPVVIQATTKNDKTNYAGVTSETDISAAALPVVYQKIKTDYAKRFGKEFIFTSAEGDE
jgi:hypothetical protein